MNISLKPMVWMYLQYGVALEAHQQNSVVQLKDGYPVKYYFRDNQGFYFCNSMKEMLNNELAGIENVLEIYMTTILWMRDFVTT